MTDVYWWLDALGALARSGQQRWLRETLDGGWYGLVNLTSMEVYPDFYSALLFSKLMSPEVLAVTVATGVFAQGVRALRSGEGLPVATAFQLRQRERYM
jgi:hypothetical protein